MVLLRNLCLGLTLAVALAGCSTWRWCRSACTLPGATPPETPSPKMPRAEPTTVKAAPGLAPPGLYIPGSAVAASSSKPRVDTLTSLPKPTPPEAETTTTLPPLTPSDPSASENPLRALAQRSAARWANVDSYACRIRRREAIAGQPRPEELLVAKFRKEPYSVYFQWLGPEAKGREVVYVQGQHGNLIHTLTAKGDVLLVSAGTRFKVAPDSLLVKNKSRYAITEAGVGPLVERFGKLVAALDQGDPRAGTVKYLGQAKRTEFENKVEVVVHEVQPGWEPQLPKGGKRLWCFDADHGLPVLIVTYDEANREVEYYCHDRFEFGGRHGDDDFNPDKLWPSR